MCDFPHRPSEIVRSIKLLEVGRDRQNEFCGSFYTYKLGKHAMSVADDLVQRHSSDILADGTFQAGVALIQGARQEQLAASSDINEACTWLALIAEVGSKALSALISWSRLRLEEKWLDLQKFVADLLSILEHAAALATSIVVKNFGPCIEHIDQKLCDGDDSNLRALGVAFVVELGTTAAKCQSDLSDMTERLFDGITAFHALCADMLKNNKGHAEMGEALGGLSDAVMAPKTWMHMLAEYMKGVQVLGPIVRRGCASDFPPYPKCVDDYISFASDENQLQISSNSPANLRADVAARTPLLKYICMLYTCQRRIRDELQMPAEDWKLVLADLPMLEVVDGIIDWIEGGSLPAAIHASLWQAWRNNILDGLLAELQTQALPWELGGL